MSYLVYVAWFGAAAVALLWLRDARIFWRTGLAGYRTAAYRGVLYTALALAGVGVSYAKQVEARRPRPHPARALPSGPARARAYLDDRVHARPRHWERAAETEITRRDGFYKYAAATARDPGLPPGRDGGARRDRGAHARGGAPLRLPACPYAGLRGARALHHPLGARDRQRDVRVRGQGRAGHRAPARADRARAADVRERGPGAAQAAPLGTTSTTASGTSGRRRGGTGSSGSSGPS